MLNGLYSATTALNAAERSHELVAENLAHVGVPGYRANAISFAAFEDALRDTLSNDDSVVGHGTTATTARTDFTQGGISVTGRPLDCAIQGDGFFVVEGPEGSLYTRNGVFFLGAEGRLVTADGYSVQGASGPISIPSPASASDVTIASDGAISVGGNPVGELKLVAFDDNQSLKRAGTTFFEAPAEAVPHEATAKVQQGARELANVSQVDQMVRMITGLRYFEAAQRVLKSMDNAVGQHINQSSQ